MSGETLQATRHHDCTLATPRIASGIAAVALGLLLAATGAALAGEQPRDVGRDESIQEALYSEFLHAGEIPAHRIRIEVEDGVAELTGAVASAAERHRVLRLAERVRGVRAIVDRLEVERHPRGDAELARLVEVALFADPVTEALTLDVEADAGLVTLQGVVESAAQRTRALEVARGIDGVRRVVNDLRLADSPLRASEDLELEVRSELDRDVVLSRRDLEVDVDGRTVSLQGRVASLEERRRASTLAWVRGVEAVDASSVVVSAEHDAVFRPAPPQADDDQIRQAVLDAFRADPRVFPPFPEVEVDDTVVTLSGTLPRTADPRALRDDAQNVAGAGPVVMEVTIESGPDVPDDQTLQAQALEALRRDAWLQDEDDLQVRVRRGEAELFGTVDRAHERVRAGRVVSEQKYIVEVENHIELAEGARPEASDAELLERVEDQLWWSTRVDARQIDARIEGGVAILTGAVETWYERRAAADEALQAGVAGVVNEIRVDGATAEPPVIEVH